MFQILKSFRKNIVKHFKTDYVNPKRSISYKNEKHISYLKYAAAGVAGILLSKLLYSFVRNGPVDQIKHGIITNENGNLRKQFNFIDKVVQKCAAAVVYIEIKDTRRVDPETGSPLTASNGSGFIIREDGYVLTNAHVVLNKPHANIVVMMNDGSVHNAVVEDADMNIDLALLKLDTNRTFPYLNLGNSKDINVGEWVVALGSPLSLSHSVTVGVVSSISRTASELGLKNFTMRYIQTDASITFGNSGGPLVNLDGDVIGINNLRITSGISFAIPIDYVKGFIERNKNLSKPMKSAKDSMNDKLLGMTTFKVTPELISELQELNLKVPQKLNHGVLVWKLVTGAVAQMSGIQVGDIITHINGVPVKETNDIYILLTNKIENSIQKVVVLRKGSIQEILVKSP